MGRCYYFWAITPGPEFRGISRESGPRSPATGFQRFDPPLGHTLLHGEAEKLTRKVGVASPKAVPQRGGGRRTAGRFRRRAGRFRRRAGQPSGVRAAHGGQKRARAGKKDANAGASGVPGVCAGAGGPGKTGGKPGLHPGARRAKNGRSRGKTGRSGGQKGGYGGRWGQKSPFLPRKRRATGLCWGENWRRKLAGRVGLFGTFRESSGGFGGKSWGLRKSLFTPI